jgi:LmbE family N-acetylglucosaminyl deacetylase
VSWFALLLGVPVQLPASESPPHARVGDHASHSPRQLTLPTEFRSEVSAIPDGKATVALTATSELRIPPAARVLIFAPHPDDETLAAGGLMQQVEAGGGSARVVFVTDGDGYVEAVRASVASHRPSTADFLAYGRQRQEEAVAAVQRLGVHLGDVDFLGFPDDGIDDLWGAHWFHGRPYVSPHTHLHRPRDWQSTRPDLEYVGVALASEIRRCLEEWQPEWIVIPDPRDGHPDHYATGVFVLEALRQWHAVRPDARRPKILGYLVHAPGYPSSPAWIHAVSHFGIGASHTARRVLQRTDWVRLPLSSSQREGKARALAEYASQLRVMRPFMQQFVRDFELFSRLDDDQITSIPHEYAAQVRHRR